MLVSKLVGEKTVNAKFLNFDKQSFINKMFFLQFY